MRYHSGWRADASQVKLGSVDNHALFQQAALARTSKWLHDFKIGTTILHLKFVRAQLFKCHVVGLGEKLVVWHVCSVSRRLHWDCDLIHPFACSPVWKPSLCHHGTSARLGRVLGWKVGSKDGCPGWSSIFWEAIRLGCCIKTDGVDLRGWSFLCAEFEKCTWHRSKPRSPNQTQGAAMIKEPRPVRALATLVFYHWFSSWQSFFLFLFSPSLSQTTV